MEQTTEALPEKKIIDLLEDPKLLEKFEELKHMRETLEEEHDDNVNFNESCMKDINTLFKDCNTSKTKVIIQIKNIFGKKTNVPSYLDGDDWIQISNSGLGCSSASLGNMQKMRRLKNLNDGSHWNFYEIFLKNPKVLSEIKKHIKPHHQKILDDMKKVLDKHPNLREPKEFHLSKELKNPNKNYEKYCHENTKKLFFSIDPEDDFKICIGYKNAQPYGVEIYTINFYGEDDYMDENDEPHKLYDLIFIDKYYNIFKQAYDETVIKQRETNGSWSAFKKEFYAEMSQYVIFNKIIVDEENEDD